jgi:hypothetical protein
MRLHAVIAITSLLAVPINANRAFAQFNYSSQNRSITAEAGGFDPGTGPLPVDDLKSASAPDFTDFVDSLSASAIFNGPLLRATANAAQQSRLAPTSITASGSVSDSGFRGTGASGGAGTGDSAFSTTFTLDAATNVLIGVNLFAHHETTNPLSTDTSKATFSFTGGAINLSQATSFFDALKDSSVNIIYALPLPSGTYTITASAHSFSGSTSFQETIGTGNGLASNASYYISIVPEPSSVILAAIGALGLVGAYFGRIRLACQCSSLTNK